MAPGRAFRLPDRWGPQKMGRPWNRLRVLPAEETGQEGQGSEEVRSRGANLRPPLPSTFINRALYRPALENRDSDPRAGGPQGRVGLHLRADRPGHPRLRDHDPRPAAGVQDDRDVDEGPRGLAVRPPLDPNQNRRA